MHLTEGIYLNSFETQSILSEEAEIAFTYWAEKNSYFKIVNDL